MWEFRAIVVAGWLTILACAIILFLSGLFNGDLLSIRVSMVAIVFSVPTLIAIIKKVK